MINNSLLNEVLNIKVPEELVYFIVRDCHNFNVFEKNGKPNINRFLNVLLPSLDSYWNEIKENLQRKYPNEVKTVVQAIQSVYLKNQFNFSEIKEVLHIRANKTTESRFIKMMDEDVYTYTTFASYARSLLYEYMLKPEHLRERLFKKEQLDEFSLAKKENCYVVVETEKMRVKLIPIDVVLNYLEYSNILVCYDNTNKETIFLKLIEVKRVIKSNSKFELNIEDTEVLERAANAMYLEERQ